jgi:uncharacterized coiled-coil protein SlyX
MDDAPITRKEFREEIQSLCAMIREQNAQMDIKFNAQNARMDAHIADLYRNLIGQKQTLETHSTQLADNKQTLDTHSNEITYIHRNVELGTCRKRSFWKDNWFMSTLTVPVIQLASSYVFAYATPDDKKNN